MWLRPPNRTPRSPSWSTTRERAAGCATTNTVGWPPACPRRWPSGASNCSPRTSWTGSPPAVGGTARTAAVTQAPWTTRPRHRWPWPPCWTGAGSTPGVRSCNKSSPSRTRTAAQLWPPQSATWMPSVRMPTHDAMWKRLSPRRREWPTGGRCPMTPLHRWRVRLPTRWCATRSTRWRSGSTPDRPSRYGRNCHGRFPSRGAWKRLCCWHSRLTPAETGRWRGCRWMRLFGATPPIAWLACSTPPCNRECGRSRFANWPRPGTDWLTGWVSCCRPGARSDDVPGRPMPVRAWLSDLFDLHGMRHVVRQLDLLVARDHDHDPAVVIGFDRHPGVGHHTGILEPPDQLDVTLDVFGQLSHDHRDGHTGRQLGQPYQVDLVGA